MGVTIGETSLQAINDNSMPVLRPYPIPQITFAIEAHATAVWPQDGADKLVVIPEAVGACRGGP